MDRKPTDIRVRVCKRGYVAQAGYDAVNDLPGEMFAFDRIEDLAEWMVEKLK